MQANNIENKKLFNAIHNKTLTLHKIKGMDQLKIGQRGEIAVGWWWSRHTQVGGFEMET